MSNTIRTPIETFDYRDPVLGPILFHGIEARLLRTREMARLRWIKQLPSLQLFYPSATHTRFEHSLGTAALVKFFINSMPEGTAEISLENVFHLVAAALLHDIGHGPWGHAGEEFLRLRGDPVGSSKLGAELVTGVSKLSKYLAKWNLPSVSEVLRRSDATQIARLIRGQPPISYPDLLKRDKAKAVGNKLWMGNLIHGHFDFDLVDYVMRDSFFALGTRSPIDPIDVVQKVHIQEETTGAKFLALDSKLAESIVVTRELMYPLYMKSEHLIFEELLQRAFDRAYPPEADMLSFRFSTDDDILDFLRTKSREDNIVKRILDLIRTRGNYEIAGELPFTKLSHSLAENLAYLEHRKHELLALEEEICDRCRTRGIHVRDGDVVIGIALWRQPSVLHAAVRAGDKVTTLLEESALISLMMSDVYANSRSKLVIGTWDLNENEKKKTVDIAIETIEAKTFQ